MSATRYALLLVTMSAASFLGGTVAIWFLSNSEAMAQSKDDVFDRISVTGLELRNSEGRPVGLFRTNDDGNPQVALFDAQGREGLNVGFNDEGRPVIGLRDRAGKERLVLGFAENGAPILRLNDTSEQPRVALIVLRDGTSLMALADASGKDRLSLGVSKTGVPGMVLSDSMGRKRLTLGVLYSEPQIEMMGTSGEIRMILAVPKEGDRLILLGDRKGKMIWSAPN